MVRRGLGSDSPRQQSTAPVVAGFGCFLLHPPPRKNVRCHLWDKVRVLQSVIATAKE